MIIMNKKDGTVVPFGTYVLLDNNIMKLESGNTQYVIYCEDIETKLYEGGAIRDKSNVKLPVIYHTIHGPMTDESVLDFGVEVSIMSVLDKGSSTTDTITV